jgi:Family of unknown function (DUF6289)
VQRRIFAVAAAAAAAAACAVLLPSGPAEAYSACPANTECGWLYYSNAAHTYEVGGHTTNCQGVVQNWGTVTSYSSYIQNGCGGVARTPA